MTTKSGTKKHYKRPIMEYVSSDVDTVRRNAVAVIELELGGNEPVLTQNSEGELNVIAVVGSGAGLSGTPVHGQQFKEALLCEVGLAKTKPYRQTKWHPGERKYCKKRRRWFTLSEEQYKSVAPLLFLKLQSRANKIIGSWKNGGCFTTSITIRNFREKATFNYRKGRAEVLSGVRFSVLTADKLLLADIYGAELRNPKLIQQMNGFARAIDARLSKHRRGYRTFNKLRAAHDVLRMFEHTSLPEHLKVETLERLPGGRNNVFYYAIKDMMEWEYGRTPESLLVDKALCRDYTNNIRFRVAYRRPEYVVVEIFKNEFMEVITD